ncbi:leucine-rich repeat serine/threonine-protein kinase 1 isoform X1 [Tachysurus ichikawai]
MHSKDVWSSWLFLVKSDLEWRKQEKDILGQGGSGTIIYKAKYRGQPVAIKHFPFKKCRQQTLNSGTGESPSLATHQPSCRQCILSLTYSRTAMSS